MFIILILSFFFFSSYTPELTQSVKPVVTWPYYSLTSLIDRSPQLGWEPCQGLTWGRNIESGDLARIVNNYNYFQVCH